MPRYEVRLEAQDGSGHFRLTRLLAADADAARRHCERLELRNVLFELDAEQRHALLGKYEAGSLEELPRPAAVDASLEEKQPFRALETQDRARLQAHFQELPYRVVSVEEVA